MSQIETGFLPYPKKHLYPDGLKDYLYDFWWDVDKLHQLALPTKPIKVAKLLWHLDLPFWGHAGEPFQVSPREVLADPVKYSAHYDRTVTANLRYPLSVREGADRLVIVDGLHRLLKTHMLGLAEIACQEIKPEHLKLMAHTEPDTSHANQELVSAVA